MKRFIFVLSMGVPALMCSSGNTSADPAPAAALQAPESQPAAAQSAPDESTAVEKPASDNEPTPAEKAASDDDPTSVEKPAAGDEPTAAEKPAEDKPSEPVADTAALVQKAHKASQVAKTDADFSAVIELCEKGLEATSDQKWADYANQLMAWAYNRRGELKSAAGREEVALDDFAFAVQLDPSRWKHHYNRGISFANTGRLDQALVDLDTSVKMKPDHARSRFNRGEVRFAKGDLAGAIQDYNETLRLVPRFAPAFAGRGFAYYSQGNLDAAFRDYDRAIALDDDVAEVYVNRADAYGDRGNYSRAEQDLRTALRLDPKNARAYLSAAWLLATCPDDRMRDSARAVEYARRAIELGGEGHYRYQEVLAAALANAGQFDEAQQAQSRAIDLAPKPEEADRCRKALELYAKGKPYRQARRRGR